MVEQNFPSQELRSEFFRQVPVLHSRKDVFPNHPTIVYVGAVDFRLAATNEERELVRAEYRYDEESGQFRLHDANEMLGAFEDGVLKSSALVDSVF